MYSINKTATSERLDSWASRHWRGIELVFKSLDCFTVQPIFQPGWLLEWRFFHCLFFIFFGWGGVGVFSSNAFTIWCCIPISRLMRVFRRFKRRSCWYFPTKIKNMESHSQPKNKMPIVHSFTKESWTYNTASRQGSDIAAVVIFRDTDIP